MNTLNIIVNATALRSGGALTILKQFIEAVPADDFTYIVFVDESVALLNVPANVQLVKLNKHSFLKRFLWDAWGVKKWLQKNSIQPFATISLQNTNFRVNTSCPNYVYYHQPLPFYPHKWNPFNSQERTLWFYKNIYPLFVRLFINPQTEIFVQLNYIKKEFIKKFHVDSEKIHVVFPKIDMPEPKEILNIVINKQKTNLFYPATPLIYKNHIVLFNAFTLIDNLLSKRVVLYLTCRKEDFNIQYSYKNIDIVFLGSLAYNEVVWMWKEIDACIFPSYIETLGLPLIEAAFLGKPIIASDLPYSKEVLDGYAGSTFIDYQDAKAWGDEILKLTSKHVKYEPFKESKNKDSWSEFFKIIKQTK